MIKLGVIGYGGRGSTVARVLTGLPYDVRLTAVADVNHEKVRERMRDRGVAEPESVRLYDDADAMLEAEELDAAVVATRCSLHAEMAIKVLARGIPLYLEKPVATTEADFRRLARAAAEATAPTVVSFPLRATGVATTARRLIEAGRLGAVTHVQAVNNVPYGEEYFQRWYRDEAETGGLFLQKATHDLDVVGYLLGEAEPVRVAAMTSKLVFTGDRPAALRCIDCPDKLACPESKWNPTLSTGFNAKSRPPDLQCCFAVDTGNEDSGNALIEYAGGVQACYTQNFYSRRGSAVRRIRCIGHLGTVEFDWTTDQLVFWEHHRPVVERHDCKGEGGHGGGDHALAVNFCQCVLGQAEPVAPLSAGLRSVLVCLLARASAGGGGFQSADAMVCD